MRLRRVLIIALAVLLDTRTSAAQEAPEKAEAPKSYGYEQVWKATLGVYDTAGDITFDVNLRRKLGDANVWLGLYVDPKGDSIGRLGADYTVQTPWLRATPSLQWATNGFLGGSIYAEVGPEAFLVAGFSQTNLKPFFNLTFDPNESVQLGAGLAIDRDRLSAFIIFDDRLGTGQQNSHLVWRHWIDAGHRLTIDALYKCGHTDEGEFVRGAGLQVTLDWKRVFVRGAYDAYANFSSDTMWRLGAGMRF